MIRSGAFARLVVLAMAIFCLPAFKTSGHGVHSSRTLIDFISATGEIQVTITLPAGDLEDFLRAETKRPLELDRVPEADKIVFTYLKRWVQLQSANGKAIPLNWVGMQVKATYVTCFLEGKATTLQGAKVKNLLLMEWDGTWTNQVIVRRDQTGTTSDHQFKKGATAFSTIRFTPQSPPTRRN
jgi:hypothetical protein